MVESEVHVYIDSMTDKKTHQQYALRLPEDALPRADVLAERLRGVDPYAAFGLSRSTMLRVAVMRGLTELEREADARDAAAKETP
jgi:hypothetical protein